MASYAGCLGCGHPFGTHGRGAGACRINGCPCVEYGVEVSVTVAGSMPERTEVPATYVGPHGSQMFTPSVPGRFITFAEAKRLLGLVAVAFAVGFMAGHVL